MAALGLGVFLQPSHPVQVPFPGVSWESAAPGGRQQQVQHEVLA